MRPQTGAWRRGFMGVHGLGQGTGVTKWATAITATFPRQYVRAVAAARRQRRRVTMCVFVISSGGVMAEGNMRIQRGDAISLELRNIGWVDGNVAWVAGKALACVCEAVDPKLWCAASPPSQCPGQAARTAGPPPDGGAAAPDRTSIPSSRKI